MSTPAIAPPPRSAGARFFAWLYTPQAAREGTAALLAIEHEIMASTREGLDHSVAHARLGWWQEETGRLCASIPQHPVAMASRNLFLAAGLPPPDLRALPELAARRLARQARGRAQVPEDEVGRDAQLWAEGLFCPLVALAAPLSADPGHAVALGRALHAHEIAPGASSGTALREALHALPAPLTGALRGLVVWATLALRRPHASAARLDALAENWTAWRAAQRALRGRS